jgi:hypothetical protein
MVTCHERTFLIGVQLVIDNVSFIRHALLIVEKAIIVVCQYELRWN